MRKEDCLNELKVKLYNEVGLYIKEDNEVKTARSKASLVKGLIDYLSSSDIYEIYENRFYIQSELEILSMDKDDKMIDILVTERLNKVFYSYFNNQGVIDESFIGDAFDKINKAKKVCVEMYENLNAQYEILNREHYQKSFAMKDYKSIHKNLKEGQIINRYQENIIKEYMKANNFSDEEQVLILEALRTHNIKCSKHLETYPTSLVEKMINNHLRKFEIDEVDETEFNSKYYNMAIDLYRTLMNYDLNTDFDDAYNLLPNQEDGYTPREFKYVYNIILNSILDDIYECIDAVSDVESYIDKDIKNTALMSYNDYLSKYFLVFKKYKKENQKFGDLALSTEDIDEEEVSNEEDDSKDNINRLTYLQNGDVAQIERDLKDINNEYYDRLLNLLKRKKKGNLPSKKDSIMKSTNDKLAGFGKLEDDQVRVLYKPMGDNVYLIIGAFVKKATSNLVGYLALAQRYNNANVPSKEKQLSEAKKLEESLFQKLTNERHIPDR